MHLSILYLKKRNKLDICSMCNYVIHSYYNYYYVYYDGAAFKFQDKYKCINQ